MNENDTPTVTFGPSAAETIINEFGWGAVDGVIVDEDGVPVESYNGHEFGLDEFGGIVEDEHGDPIPIRDNFCDIVDYVSNRGEVHE